MKYTKLTLMIIGLLFSCFSLVETAKAEGSRSYISPSGGDNRPCTRNNPCRTFDGALAKTDPHGEIIALETGTYDPTTITKSITLTAAPGADVVIRATTGNAVTINIAQEDIVVLRGLKLSGPGKNSNVNGVMLAEASRGLTFIENSVISNFGTAVHAMPNESAQLGITDSVIRNNQIGARVQFGGAESGGAFAARTRFEGNFIGVHTSGSISFAAKECVAARNNIGFLADPNGDLVISDALVTKNTKGIEARGTGMIRVASSTITSNGTGIASDTFVRSMGNNMITANEVDISVSTILVLVGI